MAAEIRVTGIHTIAEYPPLSLGMCMAYAKKTFAGESCLAISSDLVANGKQLSTLLESLPSGRSPRHVLLFSNYIWNTEENLRLSRLAKRLDPTCITIHGGPNSPAYTEASRSFLLAEPHVDFIVAGEGEETLKELLQAIASGENEHTNVSGLRYLSNGAFVETGHRERAGDINRFPSPYLTGFFDNSDLTRWESATIETFRGCPYGCTYCDWGSSMLSKVKLFDFDRVVSEIEWAASRNVTTIWVADSNFGISDRDVDIARKICEIKKRTGFPKYLLLSYAKNVKSRVVEIVRLFVDAGLLVTGTMSLQTADAETLQAVRRSNIKTTEYEKLRHAFAEKNLPLCVELMMALPGSTIEAFKKDLAYHFDLPMEVLVYRTVMLTNSPMADPAYQLEHEIEIDERSRVVATKTMSAADIETASTICRIFQGVHRFGILRYLFRWLQWEHELEPVEVIHDLVRDAGAQEQHPLLGALVRDASTPTDSAMDLIDTLVPFRERLRREGTWEVLSTEFINWATKRYNFGREHAFDDLGRVQSRLMPSEGRQFPEDVTVQYDVASWYSDRLQGRNVALSAYPPGVLKVEDPLMLSNSAYPINPRFFAWELDSGLSRARPFRPGYFEASQSDASSRGGEETPELSLALTA